VKPELHIFGLTIQTFGLCLGAAFIVAGWIVARRFGELGRRVDFAYEMVFAALIGGLVGAKLWYIAENGGPLFSGTGLVFYGGLIGGALAVIVWARYKGELDLPLVY
jgi:phosphatidylglycerol:prolipoprotein diacylglycerol transferase